MDDKLNLEEKEQLRFDTLEKSSPEVKSIYLSRDTGVFLESIAEKYGVVESDYNSFAFCVGDVIIGLEKISNLSEHIVNNTNIGEETAKQIVSDLVEFLSPIINKDRPVTPASNTTPPTNNPETRTQSAETDPAEAEDQIVQPLRTMEGDVDRIHGYGAYRKLYPDAPGPGGEAAAGPGASAPGPAAADAAEEPVVQALSQDETVQGKKNLTDLPSYSENSNQPPQTPAT